MSLAVTVQDAQDLRRLIPLNILSVDRFEKLCADTGIEEVPRGAVLFSQGDTKNEFVYVLSGTVSLQAGGMEMEAITGGTESAKFALAHQIPRKVSAIARDKVRYIRVDSDYVNQPNQRISGVATYEVSEMPEESTGDWVTTLLKSPIFQRLPPANLQQILSKLEELPVVAGQEIIHQDEPGDYYYIIKKGRCQLTRKPSRLAREVKLAELKTCDTFGEDSLISDQPRNVTVTMTTKGTVLRLNKSDFLKLVKEPVIAGVDLKQARSMVAEGACLLDVRTPDLYEEGHLPGAINIPFFRLRVDLGTLSRGHPHILVCETGRVSEAAAFLLIRNNFDAFVLKGGMSATSARELESGEGTVPAEPQPELVRPAMPNAENEERDLQMRDALDVLGKENKTLRIELSAVKGALTDMQRAFEESQSAGQVLSERISHLDKETEEARARASALAEELSRQREAPPVQPESLAELSELQTRLAEAEAVRVSLEVELKEAREAHKAKEAECLSLAADKAQFEEALRAQREIIAAQTGGDLAAPQEIERLSQHVEALAREKAGAVARQQELEGQVAELSAVVREFVEQQEAGGEGSGEVQSLRAELETVREQATTDVMAMHTKLRSAEQEVSRLKGELDSAQQRLLAWEVERQGSLDVPRQAGEKAAGSGRSGLLYALIGVVLGATLLSALALGTEVGRGYTRQLMSNLAAGQSADPAGGTAQ